MTDANDTPNTSGEGEDDRVQLLPFEQNLMLDTFVNDVLFVNARGLALERLFFNHLHLYSDPKATYFVLNTRPEDEHYFLEKLRTINPECPPKIITAEVLSADRQIIYQSGGIQFVTSRILMVDLLKDRVPFDKVYGILIYRAHEVQFGFQESFILRLFREKKPHNFTIKAFTDCPEYIVADGALGQLQRLITLLYVRRVVILPRFHNEVKACFDANQPTITQMSIKLEPAQRKAQASLRDIIATCLRELKQSTKGLDTDSDTESMASSAATLRPTKLERDLSRCDVPLTDRQQRLVTDLRMLRQLFQKVEQLDPTNALNFVHWLRKDPDILHNNSGWLFTQSAATLFSNIDALCSLRDLNGDRTISTPAKWSIFCSILQEITAKLVSEDLDYPVLVLVSSDQLSRQLIDLIKFGQRRYTWMLTRKITDPNRRDSLALAPPIEPVWNPVNVACYDVQIYEKDRQNLLNTVKVAQKEEAKKRRQKGKLDIANRDPKQPRLDQFGIQPYARPMSVPTSDKNNGSRKKRKSGREVAVAKRKSPIRIPLSREKMPGEEVYLPEDPFTSFYVHEEETKRAVNGEELPENNKSKSNADDPSIVALDDCEEEHRLPASPSPPPRILNSEEEDEERSLSLETNEHRVNKSIAGAARERAEKSIHVIDEFQFESSNISSDADVDGVGIEPNQPCTFNNSLNSMLVFLELGNRYRLINCLESLKPRHVILYSQDIACTRIIETFKAVHSDHPLELYMLMYEESSEEERYLSSIQRELEAIETLIKEQGLVMVPREFDVSRDSVSQLRRITMPNGGRRVDSRTKRTVATSSSRSQALMDADQEFEAEMRPLVIVDMREFNSELPIVLYKRGIDLEAVTLEVGDYILSPEICCERKSLDDLAQSLVNGRLFKQVEQMTKHYKNCILLIESTEKYRNRVVRIGAFQGELSRRAREARQLFVMLLQSYPQLHVLWSVSPAHSAELFEELKLDQPNPMLEAALKKRRERFVDEEI